MAKTVKVKLVRSGIGSNQRLRQHLVGLGLTRLHQVRELEDNPIVRGLIFKVRHLVEADPPAPQD
jgi:large subunit ribosomal protein L30